MKSTVFTLFRFTIALLTVLAIAGKPYIPLKTLQIYPAANTTSSIYGAPASAEGELVAWINKDYNEWRCDHRIANDVCGLTLSWNDCPLSPHTFCSPDALDPDGDGWGWENEQTCIVMDSKVSLGIHHAKAPTNIVPLSACINTSPTNTGAISTGAPQGVDFSQYDGMNIKIDYEGKAKFLRLYLRNHGSHNVNGQSTAQNDEASDAMSRSKFMSAFLRTEDLKAGETYVSFSEFSVAEWWILDAEVPRDRALPEFNHIVTVGVDHIEYGIHKMRVERVELTGERISTENLLMLLLLFWSGYLLLEAGIRYYYLYASSRLRAAQINQLTTHAEQLEYEKNTLKTLSITDPLTGALNRTGAMQKMLPWSGSDQLPLNTGILILDIDHFKKINDTYGHDAGDVILKSLTKLIEPNIRDGDVFARWGGEEFLLVTRHVSKNNLIHLAEKLRVLIAAHHFEPVNLSISVSIGAATVRYSETFASVLKRADTALYTAKKTRNCSVFNE